MRTDELKAALDVMSESDFVAFRREFGGDFMRQDYVKKFATEGQFEGRLSQLLGIPTEEERINKAAIDSANATTIAAETAVKSEDHARRANELADASNAFAKQANRFAFWSIIVASLSLMVSAVAILVATLKR